MLLAVAGTLLLVMVVRDEHQAGPSPAALRVVAPAAPYAYLGVGLALPHQLWTGQEFLDKPVATVYWWTLWVAAAGAVAGLADRHAVYRTLRHDLRVTAVVRESPDVVSVCDDRRHPRPAARAARPVLHLAVPQRPGLDPRPPLLAVGGPDGRHAADHRQGPRRWQPRARRASGRARGSSSRVRTAGCTRASAPDAKVTLLAGGIGITPLRALLEDLPQRPGDVTVIYRARNEQRPRASATELDRARPSSGARG